MGNSSENSGNKLDNTGVVELTGKIMVVSIILLFFIVFFVLCLHLYAKWFWYRRQENTTAATTRRRRRFDFAAGHQEVTLVPTLRQGLDPLVLKALPAIVFDPKVLKDGLECAVCLCEVSEGEKARLLPKCNHGFHVDCIDMWFQSHATCPLCRSPVADQSQSNCGSESTLEARVLENSGAVSINSAEAPNFPTNVLVWGNETRVSTFGHCSEEDHSLNSSVVGDSSSSSSSSSSSTESSSNRHDAVLVIDIPTQVDNDVEDQKSPVPTRLRSLKRLLTGNTSSRRVNPRNLDMEQGGGRGQT